MGEQDNGVLRRVAWSEVLPWLRIVRVFRQSLTLRAMILSAVAVVLTATGWGWLGARFGTDTPATEWLKPYAKYSWMPLADAVPDVESLRDLRDLARPNRPNAHWQPAEPVFSTWAMLSQPAFKGLVRNDPKDYSARTAACLVLCGLWGVVVWGFFGAALCRTAALRLAADERAGLVSVLRFSRRKWPAFCMAPLWPLLGVALATIPVIVLGWIMRSGPGLLLGGVLWFLALAASFVMAVLLLGALFGWPLMWSAISVEGSDSFDALSRSYAYLFQRPLNGLFYALVAAVLGWLGWILVQEFAAWVIWLAYWAAGWGCGSGQIHSILGGRPLTGAEAFGATLVRFWAGCVKLLAISYLFSYFWTAAVAIYLLLRRDVDHTEMDEVFLDADATEPSPAAPQA